MRKNLNLLKINKILVVGLGSIGKRHVRIIKERYPKIKIIALRHLQCEKNDIEKLGLTDCVTKVSEALQFNPDAAIIATPATKHIGIAQTLANAGVHLLIEKPISATVSGVELLIDTCKSKGLVLMTAYNLRFLPSLQEFRNKIQQKKAGTILSVRAEVGDYLPNWRPESDYRKSVSAQKLLGGGVLLELSHEIDYLSWIFGDFKWIKAHISKQSNLVIDVEDSAYIIFGIGSEKDSEIVVSLNMDFFRYDIIRQCTAIGEKGILCWDAIKGEVAWFAKDSKDWEVIFSQTTQRDYTYEKEIHNFFTTIEKKEDVAITGEDGLKTIKVIEAIRQSHNSGSKIDL